MKKILKNIKKAFLFGAVCLQIVLIVSQPVMAAAKPPKPKDPLNANKIARTLETRYHINKDSVKDQGETFNVGNQKVPVAEVDIFFNPTNPKFGEKVTATAIPKYFQEGVENMYFTWYIKHEGCELGLKKGDAKWKESCDLDKNGEISTNDWKIEAMRPLANGGFVKAKADYSSDTDNDGYSAHKGGRVNVQKKDYCYLHDFESGENYEIATTDESKRDESSGCDGEVICTTDETLTCGYEYTTTEGESSSSGSSSTSESSSSDGETTTSSSSTSSSSSSTYEETTEGTTEKYYKILSNSGDEAVCDLETKKMTCPEENETPRCIPDDDLNLLDPSCDQFIMCPDPPVEGTDCYKIRHEIGTTDFSCESRAISEDQIELKCEHQFPKVSGMAVGDGEFGAEEEEFWGTDPKDPSTIDNGNNDEANVAGLGMDKVTWTFVPGDKVGVIVEGQSYIPTKHDDSSVAISFALVNNIFEKEGSELCKLEKGIYQKEIKGYMVEIPFAYVSINDCLEFNLVMPTDGNQADNMEITMDFYPKNPNVGSLGTTSNGTTTTSKGGDELVVTTNTSDPNVDINQIYYKWSIYGFKGTRDQLTLDEGWVLLSNNELFRKTNNIQLLEGLGLEQLEMQLNTIEVDGVAYDFLRFFVESEEFFDTGTGSTGTTRSGRGDILVEPNSTGDGAIKISVGSTDVCEIGEQCEVLENQVVTATLPMESSNSGVNNYLWTLDGKSINTLEEGETKQGNSVTFLLEGRPGDSHVLSVIANDTASPETTTENTNRGEKLTITRNFVVTKPMVGIGPNNKINRGDVDEATGTNVCKNLNGEVDESAVMGTYTTVADPADPEAAQTMSDCKEGVFNGSGSVTITPTYYPEWIKDSLKSVKYSVNGAVVESCEDATSCEIDLSVYPIGSMANISFEAEYWQTDEQRLALKDWGVMEMNSGGKKISDSIMVKVGESSSATVGKKASKIIAGLAYNIPEQMIFMFRLMLTVATIIFASGIIMSLGQKKA